MPTGSEALLADGEVIMSLFVSTEGTGTYRQGKGTERDADSDTEGTNDQLTMVKQDEGR